MNTGLCVVLIEKPDQSEDVVENAQLLLDKLPPPAALTSYRFVKASVRPTLRKTPVPRAGKNQEAVWAAVQPRRVVDPSFSSSFQHCSGSFIPGSFFYDFFFIRI